MSVNTGSASGAQGVSPGRLDQAAPGVWHGLISFPGSLIHRFSRPDPSQPVCRSACLDLPRAPPPPSTAATPPRHDYRHRSVLPIARPPPSPPPPPPPLSWTPRSLCAFLCLTAKPTYEKSSRQTPRPPAHPPYYSFTLMISLVAHCPSFFPRWSSTRSHSSPRVARPIRYRNLKLLICRPKCHRPQCRSSPIPTNTRHRSRERPPAYGSDPPPIIVSELRFQRPVPLIPLTVCPPRAQKGGGDYKLLAWIRSR
jgi:hypothetical protein